MHFYCFVFLIKSQNMNQWQCQDVYLLVASSGKKQVIKTRDPSFKTSPLDGVNYDIGMFRDKLSGKNFQYIESSREPDMLLPKKYIKSWLSRYFQANFKQTYLFYTGHGWRGNGDWIVETSQKPEGDIFSLEQLLQIWELSQSQGYLYIFLDSCYSGGWCHRLNQKSNRQRISIFSCCDTQEVAFDVFGGSLFKCLFCQQIELEQHLKFLYFKQTPYVIHRSSAPTKLTGNHIKMLNKNIRNVNRLHQIDANQMKISNQAKNCGQKKKYLIRSSEIIQQRTSKYCILQDVKTQIFTNGNQLDLPKKISHYLSNQVKKPLFILDLSEIPLGHLPNSIDALPGLRKLYLYDTSLSQISSSIGLLSYLTVLNLSKNKISKLPDQICNLVALKDLYLQQNQISQLPDSFGQLCKVKHLWMEGNPLQQLPSSFENLKQLKKLWLTIQKYSFIEVTSVNIKQLQNLKELGIYYKKPIQVRKEQKKIRKFMSKCDKKCIKMYLYQPDIQDKQKYRRYKWNQEKEHQKCLIM